MPIHEKIDKSTGKHYYQYGTTGAKYYFNLKRKKEETPLIIEPYNKQRRLNFLKQAEE